MSLIGEYKFECNEGLLILHPNLRHMQCFLVADSGVIPLCPRHDVRSGQYLLPFGHRRSMDNILNIVDSLTDRIVQTVSRFRKNKAALLKICFNVGRPAVELMEDCPALISLIAARLDSNLPVREYAEKAMHLTLRKRKEILSFFSYPSSASVIRLLRKIPASDTGPAHLEAFRKILVDGNSRKIKILRHAKHINRLVLHLLSDKYFPSRVHPSLVLEAGELTNPEEMEEVWLQISEMDRIIEAAPLELNVPVLRRLESLESVHDMLVAEYREARRYREIVELTFPKPPLPGMELAGEENVPHGIFPLQNGIDLLCEGLEMEHCIATYAHQIAGEMGRLYAYHVQLPGKAPATVLIRNNLWHDTPRLEEIRGHHNSAADPAVRLFVNNWLAKRKTGQDRHDEVYIGEPSVPDREA
jgi:hypothetical protein